MAEAKNEKKLIPHFKWCQDMDRLLIRLELSNVKIDDTELDITKDAFSFQYKNYELKFSFRFPVNPKTIKYRATRLLDLVIEKEEADSYWPHLLPKLEKKKLKNHCQIDWDRFLDEDDAKKSKSGVVEDDDDTYGNLPNRGGMGGRGGMPGMGGMGGGGMGGMGGMGNMAQMMQGMQGMGGGGGGGMGGMGGLAQMMQGMGGGAQGGMSGMADLMKGMSGKEGGADDAPVDDLEVKPEDKPSEEATNEEAVDEEQKKKEDGNIDSVFEDVD